MLFDNQVSKCQSKICRSIPHSDDAPQHNLHEAIVKKKFFVKKLHKMAYEIGETPPPPLFFFLRWLSDSEALLFDKGPNPNVENSRKVKVINTKHTRRIPFGSFKWC